MKNLTEDFTEMITTDASLEGNGWETELGNYGPRRGAMYLQDSLLNFWGTTELPRQGVSMTVSDVYGDADFFSLACSGYRHHIGGGKLPHPWCP